MAIHKFPFRALHDDHVAVECPDSSRYADFILKRYGDRGFGLQVRIQHSVQEIAFHGTPLPVDRGDRVLVVQMLFAAFAQEDRKIIVGFNHRLDALTIYKEQREHLAVPDGFVQKGLLDIRFAR